MKNFLAIFIFYLLTICPVFSQNPGLTAVFDGKRNIVSIKWQHADMKVIQYALQRSSDNFTWNEIYKVDAINLKKNKITKFSDQVPRVGKGYYRLKLIMNDAGDIYSKSIMVIIGIPGNNWLMYPVPVHTILNLQYNGIELINGVVTVFIRTMKGQILTRLRFASTTRLIQIPVDNLGRGTYDIQILIKNDLVWNQRFIK